MFSVEKLNKLLGNLKQHNALVFPVRLRELSDIAKMQVEALEARQQCKDKEVESLRMQVLDYQVQQY